MNKGIAGTVDVSVPDGVSGTRSSPVGVVEEPGAETRVELPPAVGSEFQLYVNGIRQERGKDFRLDGRTLVFPRTLIPERKMSPFEWFLVTFGIGKYRKHDSIDVLYQREGRNLVALLRPPDVDA